MEMIETDQNGSSVEPNLIYEHPPVVILTGHLLGASHSAAAARTKDNWFIWELRKELMSCLPDRLRDAIRSIDNIQSTQQSDSSVGIRFQIVCHKYYDQTNVSDNEQITQENKGPNTYALDIIEYLNARKFFVHGTTIQLDAQQLQYGHELLRQCALHFTSVKDDSIVKDASSKELVQHIDRHCHRRSIGERPDTMIVRNLSSRWFNVTVVDQQELTDDFTEIKQFFQQFGTVRQGWIFSPSSTPKSLLDATIWGIRVDTKTKSNHGNMSNDTAALLASIPSNSMSSVTFDAVIQFETVLACLQAANVLDGAIIHPNNTITTPHTSSPIVVGIDTCQFLSVTNIMSRRAHYEQKRQEKLRHARKELDDSCSICMTVLLRVKHIHTVVQKFQQLLERLEDEKVQDSQQITHTLHKIQYSMEDAQEIVKDLVALGLQHCSIVHYLTKKYPTQLNPKIQYNDIIDQLCQVLPETDTQWKTIQMNKRTPKQRRISKDRDTLDKLANRTQVIEQNCQKLEESIEWALWSRYLQPAKQSLNDAEDILKECRKIISGFIHLNETDTAHKLCTKVHSISKCIQDLAPLYSIIGQDTYYVSMLYNEHDSTSMHQPKDSHAEDDVSMRQPKESNAENASASMHQSNDNQTKDATQETSTSHSTISVPKTSLEDEDDVLGQILQQDSTVDQTSPKTDKHPISLKENTTDVVATQQVETTTTKIHITLDSICQRMISLTKHTPSAYTQMFHLLESFIESIHMLVDFAQSLRRKLRSNCTLQSFRFMDCQTLRTSFDQLVSICTTFCRHIDVCCTQMENIDDNLHQPIVSNSIDILYSVPSMLPTIPRCSTSLASLSPTASSSSTTTIAAAAPSASSSSTTSRKEIVPLLHPEFNCIGMLLDIQLGLYIQNGSWLINTCTIIQSIQTTFQHVFCRIISQIDQCKRPIEQVSTRIKSHSKKQKPDLWTEQLVNICEILDIPLQQSIETNCCTFMNNMTSCIDIMTQQYQEAMHQWNSICSSPMKLAKHISHRVEHVVKFEINNKTPTIENESHASSITKDISTYLQLHAWSIVQDFFQKESLFHYSVWTDTPSDMIQENTVMYIKNITKQLHFMDVRIIEQEVHLIQLLFEMYQNFQQLNNVLQNKTIIQNVNEIYIIDTSIPLTDTNMSTYLADGLEQCVSGILYQLSCVWHTYHAVLDFTQLDKNSSKDSTSILEKSQQDTSIVSPSETSMIPPPRPNTNQTSETSMISPRQPSTNQTGKASMMTPQQLNSKKTSIDKQSNTVQRNTDDTVRQVAYAFAEMSQIAIHVANVCESLVSSVRECRLVTKRRQILSSMFSKLQTQLQEEQTIFEQDQETALQMKDDTLRSELISTHDITTCQTLVTLVRDTQQTLSDAIDNETSFPMACKQVQTELLKLVQLLQDLVQPNSTNQAINLEYMTRLNDATTRMYDNAKNAEGAISSAHRISAQLQREVSNVADSIKTIRTKFQTWSNHRKQCRTKVATKISRTLNTLKQTHPQRIVMTEQSAIESAVGSTLELDDERDNVTQVLATYTEGAIPNHQDRWIPELSEEDPCPCYPAGISRGEKLRYHGLFGNDPSAIHTNAPKGFIDLPNMSETMNIHVRHRKHIKRLRSSVGYKADRFTQMEQGNMEQQTMTKYPRNTSDSV